MPVAEGAIIRLKEAMRTAVSLAAGLVILQGCGSVEKKPDHRNLCKIGMLCDEIAPPPVRLLPSLKPSPIDRALRVALGRDFPDPVRSYELGPYRQTSWVDQHRNTHLPLRLFFVSNTPDTSIGALWVQFDHTEGQQAKTQILMTQIDRRRVDFIADPPRRGVFAPYRIAVIDKRTRTGPTFVSGYPQIAYVRHEHASDYVRNDWERAVTSSCGGGPLTDVPRTWKEERARDCAELQDRSAKWPERLRRGLKGIFGVSQ